MTLAQPEGGYRSFSQVSSSLRTQRISRMPVDLSSIPVPDDLAAVAGEKGIPLDLIRRALVLKFPADQIKQQLSAPDSSLEETEAFIKEQERIAAGGEIAIPPELAAVAG